MTLIPPRVAPRKEELDAIIAILESSKYDDAKSMARAIVAESFALLARRQWYTIGQWEGTESGRRYLTQLGFFATESAALRAIEKNSLALMGGQAGVLEVNAIGQRADYLDAQDATLRKDCADCGHIYGAHHWPRAKVAGCIIASCPCDSFRRAGSDLPDVEQ